MSYVCLMTTSIRSPTDRPRAQRLRSQEHSSAGRGTARKPRLRDQHTAARHTPRNPSRATYVRPHARHRRDGPRIKTINVTHNYAAGAAGGLQGTAN